MVEHPTPLRTRRSVAGIVPALSIAAVLATGYGAFAVRRHELRLTTGYDLGIFEQSVRSWSRWHWPVAELKGPGFPLLGDHFSPIIAVLGPIYRLFPSPITLLVAQAVLLAAGVVPLVCWAHRASGRGTAVVVGFGYGLSLGIVNATAFDFHEIAFAVPLLAMVVNRLGQGHPQSAIGWALPLLLVKEDMGLIVTAVGILIVVRHPDRRRLGWIVAAAGLLCTVIVVVVVIPAVNPLKSNAYLPQLMGGGALHQPAVKVMTIVLLVAPTAFQALRSPLMLLALPTLAWRFLSANESYWVVGFHYDAVLMPIVFGSLVEVLGRRGRPAGVAVPVFCVLVTMVGFLSGPMKELTDKDLWSTPPRIVQELALLDRIPDGARVAAGNRVAPQLTSRTTVALATPDRIAAVDYLAVDLTDPWPADAADQTELLRLAYEAGFVTVGQAGNVLVLVRDGS